MTDDLAYPSVDLVLDLHEQIIAEGDTTEPGVRSENAIALEMGKLDGRRHAEIYAALEDE